MGQIVLTSYLDLEPQAVSPGPPQTGKVRVYVDASETLHRIESDGADTAVGGGLGASVTVKGIGGGQVDNVTEFRAAGVVAGDGEGVATQGLVLSRVRFDFDFTTPNLIDPEDNGPIAFTCPAGSSVLCHLIIWTVWDNLTSPAAALVAGDASDGDVRGPIALWTSLAPNANAFVAVGTDRFTSQAASAPAVAGYVPGQFNNWFETLQESVVCFSLFSNGTPPTTGSGTLFALIASPAA